MGSRGWKRVGLGICKVGGVGFGVGAPLSYQCTHCNSPGIGPLNIKCNILDTNHNLYVNPNLLATAV